MRRSNSSLASLCVGICSLIALLGNGVAKVKAAGGVTSCAAVYETALEQERAGHLNEASAIYQSCSADSCGNPVRQLCQAKLFRLELDTPSVVPLAKDSEGAPIVDVQVTMDGISLASRLDGRAFSVDPGLHEFVFSTDGDELSSQQMVIATGQRNREIWLELPPPSAPMMNFEAEPSPAPPEKPEQLSIAPMQTEAALAPRIAITSSDPPQSHASLTPYILGGGALVSAGAYLLLSSWARGDNDKLSQCSPNCSRDSITHIRTLYVAADISLGVAAAAALTSVAWFVFSDSSSNAEHAPQRGYALSLQPERDGALATVKGSL
ncbi:MAG TPA: hypothetical protein VFG30_43635 [Polyangiales bacterium]|nr:hypothetical protein [Polyangiales bacterium]